MATLDLNTILKDAENYTKVPMIEELDLNVNGTSTTPVVVSFSQWTELDGSPNPTSLAVVVSEIELYATFADPTFAWSNLMDGAAATVGGLLRYKKEGVTVNQYPLAIKTNADISKLFADFSSTVDSQALETIFKAVRNFFVEDGDYLYMDGLSANDAVEFLVRDDWSSLGNDIKLIIRGFGYIPKK